MSPSSSNPSTPKRGSLPGIILPELSGRTTPNVGASCLSESQLCSARSSIAHSGSLSPSSPSRRTSVEGRPRLQIETAEDVDMGPAAVSVQSSCVPSTIISARARPEVRSQTERSWVDGASSDSTWVWGETAAFWMSPTSASRKTSESSRRSKRSSAVDHLISVDEGVVDLISFRGSEELLRGVPLGQVLRSGGRIFATSTGSEETYSLSQPVDNIQAFISHNWATPRYQKFFALSFHYNFDAAVLALVAACLVIGLLTFLDSNPNQVWPSNTRPYPISVVARSVCPLVFFAVLFAKHDLQALFCRRLGPSIFLDKVCINQVDPELQARSIRKLGAFVCESEQVVALYSELYLRKLWTVYEVASFLVLRPEESVVIVAIWQVLIFLAVFLLFTLIQLSTVMMQVLAPFEAMLMVAGYLFGLGFMPTLRSWARIRGSLEGRLETFRVRECTCTNEEDRPIVHGNIASLMRASGTVAPESTLDEALAAFDHLVRTDLAKAFAEALGRHGFAYKHYLCVGIAVSGTKAADYLGRGNHGMPAREVAASMLCDLSWIGIAWPFIFMLTEHGASSQLKLRGAAERLWVVAASFLFTITPFGFFYYGLWYVSLVAAESNTLLAANVVFLLAGSLAVYKLHSCFSKRSKRLAASPGPSAAQEAQQQASPAITLFKQEDLSQQCNADCSASVPTYSDEAPSEFHIASDMCFGNADDSPAKTSVDASPIKGSTATISLDEDRDRNEEAEGGTGGSGSVAEVEPEAEPKGSDEDKEEREAEGRTLGCATTPQSVDPEANKFVVSL